MPDRVRITDVSPRDGLQNEAGIIPTADKIRLIELLAAAGLDEVEATSFVSPKWVPQLADADAVIRGVADLTEGVRSVAGAMPPRVTHIEDAPTIYGLPLFSVLVPNEKGMDRAEAAKDLGIDLKVAMFTAASETFSQKNTNASIAETIERFRPIVPRALRAGIPIRFYISCAIACPFEGAIDPAGVRSVADRLLALLPDDESRARIDIDLGDTIGVADPDDIVALLTQFDAPMRRQITVHLHDTFGRAAACVRSALALGIRSFDGSVAGLGGCPYASTPEKRAPGNISTEVLIDTIVEAGYRTSVDRDLLAEAGRFARYIVDRSRQGTDR
jgi:hydroxymethylglutaryl-CoA lyase